VSVERSSSRQLSRPVEVPQTARALLCIRCTNAVAGRGMRSKDSFPVGSVIAPVEGCERS
jgi:hypothetical protein